METGFGFNPSCGVRYIIPLEIVDFCWTAARFLLWERVLLLGHINPTLDKRLSQPAGPTS